MSSALSCSQDAVSRRRLVHEKNFSPPEPFEVLQATNFWLFFFGEGQRVFLQHMVTAPIVAVLSLFLILGQAFRP